jgi:hypothetical protein
MNGMGRGILLAVCAAALTIGTAGTALAASSGNPVLNPMAREFTLSVEMGYLNRDMDPETERKGDRSDSDELSSYGMSVRGTYGVTPRLAVFGRIGMSDLRLDRFDVSGSLEPSYGGGLMLALYRAERDPSINLVLSAAFDRFESGEGDIDLSANQYTGSLIMTKGVEDLLLYGGVRLSSLDLSGDPVPDMDASDTFGILAGVDYGLSERVYLAVELHIFDEYAVVAGLGFNFGR